MGLGASMTKAAIFAEIAVCCPYQAVLHPSRQRPARVGYPSRRTARPVRFAARFAAVGGDSGRADNQAVDRADEGRRACRCGGWRGPAMRRVCGPGKRKSHPEGWLFWRLARWTGLEPATPGVTGRYSNQLSYHRIASPVARCVGVLRKHACGVKRESDENQRSV